MLVPQRLLSPDADNFSALRGPDSIAKIMTKNNGLELESQNPFPTDKFTLILREHGQTRRFSFEEERNLQLAVAELALSQRGAVSAQVAYPL